MPLAVVLGVPMYASTATLIPIVQALLAKGAALGAVLAFMMAVVGLSLPEAILLRRVLRPRLLAAFMGVVAAGILLVGRFFNAVLWARRPGGPSPRRGRVWRRYTAWRESSRRLAPPSTTRTS